MKGEQEPRRIARPWKCKCIDSRKMAALELWLRLTASQASHTKITSKSHEIH